jgi:hypothetical protein
VPEHRGSYDSGQAFALNDVTEIFSSHAHTLIQMRAREWP